jgi:hypothetical protein
LVKKLLCVLFAIVPLCLGGGRRYIDVQEKDRVLPHIAFGGGWSTTITLVDCYETEAPFTLRFYDDRGVAMNVPVAGLGSVSIISDRMPVNGSRTYEIQDIGVTQTGWAELSYDWSLTAIGGLAVFRQRVAGRPDLEAVVPMSANNDGDYHLAFDNTGGLVYGLALANPDLIQSTVEMTFTDDSGNAIGVPVTLTMDSKAHTAFALAVNYPQLANRRGVIHFQMQTGHVSALGLRFNGWAFSSAHTLRY